jgi:hypothetical protein
VPVITLLALPLPILTAVLWRGSESLFGPPQEGLSLEAAAALDRRDQVFQDIYPCCYRFAPTLGVPLGCTLPTAAHLWQRLRLHQRWQAGSGPSQKHGLQA